MDNLNSAKKQLEIVLNELTESYQKELNVRDRQVEKLQAENEILRKGLNDEDLEELELTELNSPKTSQWDEIMGQGIENVVKRNPKILTDGFGVPEEVVKKVFGENPQAQERKLPLCAECEKLFQYR